MKEIIIFILSFIWGIPQNILALIILPFLGVNFPGKYINHGIVFQMSYKGGLTLGNFIFVDNFNEDLIKHESGHIKQSWVLGPLYLLIIGLPSICWVLYRRKFCPYKKYESFYTENWLIEK